MTFSGSASVGVRGAAKVPPRSTWKGCPAERTGMLRTTESSPGTVASTAMLPGSPASSHVVTVVTPCASTRTLAGAPVRRPPSTRRASGRVSAASVEFTTWMGKSTRSPATR
jgi:hypothetical protein